MKPNLIQRAEVVDIAAYEHVREERRRAIIELKKSRRWHVGEHVTLLAENKATMLYQVQEMMRTERIVKEAAIAHEIETYNQLISSADALRCTLLVEFADPKERDIMLRKLLGLDQHLFMVVGGSVRVKAQFDDQQIGLERISSVQYIRFPLDAALRQALAAGGPVEFQCDHPAYSAIYRLNSQEIGAIMEDIDLS